MHYSKVMIGNTSSGIIEAASFGKYVINVGDRQLGRIQASSVINCEPKEKDIKRAIEALYSLDFKSNLADTTNPYGEGGASARIVKVLKEASLEGIVKKTFYDL